LAVNDESARLPPAPALIPLSKSPNPANPISLDPFNTQCLAGGLTASEPAALGCLDAAPAEPGAAAPVPSPTLLPGAGAPTAAGAARAAAPGPGGGPAPPPAAGPRWQDLRGRGSAAHDILANKQ